MLRFHFDVLYINDLAWGDTELLNERWVESAYEAIVACLDPSQKADLLQVNFRHGRGAFAEEFSPYETWGTLEKFQHLMNDHILAMKIQLNVDISQDRAAEDILINAIDNRRLSTRS